MAQDTAPQTDGIVRDRGSVIGPIVVKSTGIAVEEVLAKLAARPDIEAFLLEHPDLTVDDVSAVLAYARARVVDSPDDDQAGFVSPQDFYRDAVQRDDIRRILAALAK